MRPTSVIPDPLMMPDSAPPSPGRLAVVVNGNAKRVDQEVISTLDRILAGGDLFVSRRLSDAREIARTIVARGYQTVLTGGGDGTFTVVVTEVIRQARRERAPYPRFGLLKLGTGNALAWVVGSTNDKSSDLGADVARLSSDAGSRPIRLIEVEDWIAPFCGVGADAALLADYTKVRSQLAKTPVAKYAPGLVSYLIAAATRTIPNTMVRAMPYVRIINTGDEAYRLGPKGTRLGMPIPNGHTIYEGPARIAALSTIPYYGFGFRVFPYANERADRMHLRVATLGAGPFVLNFKAIWRGEYESSEYLFDYLVQSVTVESDPATAFQVGGDYVGERSLVSARLTSEEIRLVDFYSPPSAA